MHYVKEKRKKKTYPQDLLFSSQWPLSIGIVDVSFEIIYWQWDFRHGYYQMEWVYNDPSPSPQKRTKNLSSRAKAEKLIRPDTFDGG